MIHQDTVPVQVEGCSITQSNDLFSIESGKGEIIANNINSTAILFWQLSNGLRSLGDIATLLHDQYPEEGHYIDIGLVDGFRALVEAGALQLVPPESIIGESDLAELCVLFVYHKVDAVTRRHLDLLTWFNPQAIVIPLGHNLTGILESSLETVDIVQFDSRWDLSDPWRSVDAMIYTWFLNREQSAKRYLLAEYDCHCTMPIDIAYRKVWDADVAAKGFFLQKDYPTWKWFAEISRLSPLEQPFAAGVPPLAGILFSHHALDILSQEVSSADVFSEFRLATTAHRMKLKICNFPKSLHQNTCCYTHDYNYRQPGVFHPVKQYITYGQQAE